jgi:hypothetical protein
MCKRMTDWLATLGHAVKINWENKSKLSTLPFPRNKNTCLLTLVNFITEEPMLKYTYLYENAMFTNK